jgi:hypothetical protein
MVEAVILPLLKLTFTPTSFRSSRNGVGLRHVLYGLQNIGLYYRIKRIFFRSLLMHNLDQFTHKQTKEGLLCKFVSDFQTFICL